MKKSLLTKIIVIGTMTTISIYGCSKEKVERVGVEFRNDALNHAMWMIGDTNSSYYNIDSTYTNEKDSIFTISYTGSDPATIDICVPLDTSQKPYWWFKKTD